MNKLSVLFSSFLFAFSSLYSVTEPSLGQTVQSPTKSYTLVKELGSGALGKVFEVIATNNDNFALKWYMPNSYLDWYMDRLADYKREFNLGQILDHPNIIKSVESFADNEESNYTVLEFVSGKMLSSCPKNSLKLEESINAAKQFISGIRYAFNQEFLHLDLHGNNVMLNDNQQAKIIDLSSFFSFQEITDHDQDNNQQSSYWKPEAFKKINQFIKKHHMGYGVSPVTAVTRYIVSYFDDVTDICIRIVLCAKLTREERLNIKAELKTISWNCESDLEEGKTIYFEEHLDAVDQFLDTL